MNIAETVDEQLERNMRNLADDVSLLLDEKDIDHETHVEWDGDEGWHVVVTAGHQVHGSPMREYTVSYISAEKRWMYTAVTQDGDEEGPHELTSLAGTLAPVEVAEYIAGQVDRA